MGGMAGFNLFHGFHWFSSGGDQGGDISHNAAAAPDGNFFNDANQSSGAANPSGAASVYPSASGASYPIGAYAGYVNSALQAPGQQAPLQGGPAVMQGPQQGPWAYSDYAAALPAQYTSAAPPWKNGPMQAASHALPAAGQVAVHATGQNPPVTYTPSAPQGGSCPGCAGGCGGGRGSSKSFCQGLPHQALALDSTRDFPPLYSQYQANPTQAVNAALYHHVSTHVPSWTTAQGAPSDSEQPLQGH